MLGASLDAARIETFHRAAGQDRDSTHRDWEGALGAVAEGTPRLSAQKGKAPLWARLNTCRRDAGGQESRKTGDPEPVIHRCWVP